MVTLGPCLCANCGSVAPGVGPCDYIAFLYGNGRVPINTFNFFQVDEGHSITYTVARLPACNPTNRFCVLGAPSNPPGDGTEEGAYWYDQTGGGSFYQVVDGVWEPSGPPPEYGRGAITVNWQVLLNECGCAHMIPAASGTLSWSDGDTADKTFTVAVGHTGTIPFWTCNGSLGGGEVGRVILTLAASDRCAGIDIPSGSQYGANLTAVCNHHWPNGGTGTHWQPEVRQRAAACRLPANWLSVSAANANQGFANPSFDDSFQNRVSVIKNLAGNEVGRLEQDFDPTGQWLLQGRRRGAPADTHFTGSRRIVSNTPTHFEEVNQQVGDTRFGWRRVITATNPAIAPYDWCVANMDSPTNTLDIPSLLASGATYDSTSGGGWDEILTFNRRGVGPLDPGVPGAVAYRKSGLTNPEVGFGGFAVAAEVTLDCSGSYSGNPNPHHMGSLITQCAIDPTGGPTTCTTASGGDVTDTTLTLGPGDVANDPGYATLAAVITDTPPGCPAPTFVCYPGLPRCP